VKRRLTGAVLLIPLAAVMPSMIKSCERGGDIRMGGGGSVVDGLLSIVFMAGVPMALVGLYLLFGKTKR
jgi:hypothetical protein